MNIADVQAFVAVAELRSIRAAADSLHLSQSAVTRRLQSLEQVLGVSLLHRSSRPLRLTSDGEGALQHARTVLQAAQEMETALMPGQVISGDFRLGVSLAIGDIALTRPLDGLREQYPKLRVTAITDESKELLGRLQRHELDVVVIALPAGKTLPGDVNGEELITDTLVAVVKRDFPFKRGGGLRDLAGQPWFVNPLGCSARDALESAYTGAGLKLDIALESPSPGLKLALIENGRGVGLFLPHVIRNSRFFKTTKMLKLSDFNPRTTVWVVYQQNMGKMREPIQLVREIFCEKAHNSEADSKTSI